MYYISLTEYPEGGKYGLWAEMPEDQFIDKYIVEIREIENDYGLWDKSNSGEISACEDGTLDCFLEPLWITGKTVWTRTVEEPEWMEPR